jgi:hypothetical protein
MASLARSVSAAQRQNCSDESPQSRSNGVRHAAGSGRPSSRAEAPKAAYYASSNAYLHAAEILNPGAAHHDRAFGRGQAAVEQRQADALRDIFGPTLFRAIGLDSRWLTSTVLDLAKFIYREKSFGRLPILADVLMEAGCDDETLLGHCQGGRPHVRGCWLVDLILGKC